ncbi:MAG: SDR family oxidoreductase [Firmicutes bacterium]|jgi:3-oxoacyl-[acyl-carrier protein] reductase|nr:SDR family oxidoreductase [Bacillota bacterium]
MDLKLSGKTAVVTGGARGIGEATCKVLAEEGASVAVFDILAEDAEKTAQEIRDAGGKAVACPVDLSSYSSVKEAMNKAKAELGPIDIVACVAAITDNMATIEKMPIEKWAREIKVNLSGCFYCVKETVDSMIERKFGRYIFVSSRAGMDGGFGQCSYSASKMGLIGFARSLALEYARMGVTSNVVFPGLVNTPATAGLSDEARKRIIARGVMGRLQDPEELGNAIAFLASEQAKGINGAELMVSMGPAPYSLRPMNLPGDEKIFEKK